MKIRNLRNTNARQLFAERRARGFTLIELVIVLVIVGILAAVAIPQFTNLTDEAQNNAAEAQFRSAATAALAENYNGGTIPITCTLIDAELPTGSPYTITDAASGATIGENGNYATADGDGSEIECNISTT